MQRIFSCDPNPKSLSIRSAMTFLHCYRADDSDVNRVGHFTSMHASCTPPGIQCKLYTSRSVIQKLLLQLGYLKASVSTPQHRNAIFPPCYSPVHQRCHSLGVQPVLLRMRLSEIKIHKLIKFKIHKLKVQREAKVQALEVLYAYIITFRIPAKFLEV